MHCYLKVLIPCVLQTDELGCHYIIDLDIGKSSPREPDYSKNPDRFRVTHTIPFLNHEK